MGFCFSLVEFYFFLRPASNASDEELDPELDDAFEEEAEEEPEFELKFDITLFLLAALSSPDSVSLSLTGITFCLFLFLFPVWLLLVRLRFPPCCPALSDPAHRFFKSTSAI